MVQVKDYEYIKTTNKRMVFQHILKEAPISRAALSRLTKMSPTTITRIVKELMEQRYVHETNAEVISNQVGRRAIIIDVIHDSVITIGVFINKHVQQIGIMGLNNKVIAYEEMKVETDNPNKYIKNLCNDIEEMIISSKVKRDHIVGIGIGVPGIVDTEKGIVNLSATLEWKSIDLAEIIEKKLNINTVVDNELKAQALAEYRYGKLKQAERTAIISFGSGVGSALIVNNEVYRGWTNSAGEIGHTTVDVGGKRCQCGKKGCLQTYIIEEELIKRARKHCQVNCLEDIFVQYKEGKLWAIQLIDQAIKYIYITISNVVCMYNPDSIIIDGLLIDKLRKNNMDIIENNKDNTVWQPLDGTFKTSYSSLGNRGVTIGAGLLAQQNFFELE